MRAGSSNKAVAHLRSSLKNFDTIRAYLIWEDAWKISFRKIHEGVCGYFWLVLIAFQKTDKALHAAEEGRAQALLDALKIKYVCSSPLTMSNETEDLALILRKISVSTIFIAMEDKTINLWVHVLGEKSNTVFTQGELKKGDAHEDFFVVLLKDTLKKIGTSRNIRCENQSLDGPRNKAASSGDDGKNSNPSRVKTDYVQALHDAVFGPIDDLLEGDQLIVVPDGALCLAPWAALSETLRIRIIPSLTSLKVIKD